MESYQKKTGLHLLIAADATKPKVEISNVKLSRRINCVLTLL